MRPANWHLLLVALLASGCGSPSGPDGGGTITSDITIAGGGFSDTGVEGFGNLDLPNSWEHMFGRQQEGDDINGSHECRDQHRCGVGGATRVFGLLSTPDSFAVVTTGDFRCEPGVSFNNPDDCGLVTDSIPVTVSGVRTTPALRIEKGGQTWTGALLRFQYTLLSGRSDPAGGNDSVVVRILPQGGSATTVLRLKPTDLGASLPLRASGCGQQALPSAGGVVTSYPSCSEWHDAEVDISNFIGQLVQIEFVAGEAGAAIALAFDDVRIEVSR